MWRDVRVVDCGALEKLCPVKGTRGSNPRLSAKSGEITPVSWTEICYNEMGVLLYAIYCKRSTLLLFFVINLICEK